MQGVIEAARLHATYELDEAGVVKKCQEGGFCWMSHTEKPPCSVALPWSAGVPLVLEGSTEELSCEGQRL